MKPVFEKTPQAGWESLHCEAVDGPSFGGTWHFHPEHQLTLVLRGRGYRLVGDNITPLATGDLVLVGGNLPHVWHQEENVKNPAHAVQAIIVRFHETFLGRPFLETPEMEPVVQLLQRAARGLHVTRRTRDDVAERMVALSRAKGLGRVAELLAVLDLLARSRELQPIASPGFVPLLDADDQGRMERVCQYIHLHLAEPIEREAVATQAHLSPGAFSRFFKLRTGTTLPQYVNELRVGRACRMLAEDDTKISDIALDCGFENLSNFNRRFLAVTRLTPNRYRREFRLNAE